MSQKKDPYNVCDLAPACDTSGDIKIVMLPMRDGIKLQTIVYFPVNVKKKAPAVFIRTPYTRTTELLYPYNEAHKRGIITIYQACRGTGWSEGVFDPANPDNEKNDAEDTFLWLKSQPWYNGRCVMLGASYPGWVQWCAMETGDHLVATAPQVAPLYSCQGSAAPGGAVRFSFTLCWVLTMHHRRKYGYGNIPDYEGMGLLSKLPVIDADKNALYPELPVFRKFFLAARTPAKLLGNIAEKFKKYTCPAYISGGWFDPFCGETILSFMLMKSVAATEKARNFTRLVIGPWGHGGLLNPEVFGKDCDYRNLTKWRHNYLFGLLKNPEKDPLPEEPAVRYYMLCENKWYESETWPPAGTKERKFYLHSNGSANTLYGDGILSETPPLQEEPDVYLSNPNAPVLSNNGKHASLGCHDRSDIEKRSDVLVYTSPVLTEPVTVAGEVKLRFSAKVSTPDTDFAATLSWVTPDGKSMLITTGMLRARFRDINKEELLTPGELYDFEISLGHTAVKFTPGCAIRLALCGQHFPMYDRNANSGKTILEDTELVISRHTIYHDTKHPAELILPCL